MAVNLTKGQKISLTKESSSLSNLIIGLAWDPVKTGFFGFGQANIDCDSSVLCLDENNKLADLIYFGNKRSKDGGVNHSGDNLTGQGDGDDEQIKVDLTRIAPDINKLMFVINIYDAVARRQDFGKIKNAFGRVFEEKTGKELCRFSLSDDYTGKTTLIVGEIYRHSGEWKFNAIGEGTNDPGLKELVGRYK